MSYKKLGVSPKEFKTHVNDKENPHGVTKAQVGLDKVINSQQATKAEFDDHVKNAGNYQEAGHLKLSNSLNSQSSVSDGVAATPKAVKEVYDHSVVVSNKLNSHSETTGTAIKAGHLKLTEVGIQGADGGYALAPRALYDHATIDYATKSRAGHVQVGDGINVNSRGVISVPKVDLTPLNAHAKDKNNPHNVTKEQVGLGSVTNTKQASEAEFNEHKSDGVAHVTKEERGVWDAKETTEGAQQKADEALAESKAYTDAHAKTTGDFSNEGHVKLSNHTNSASSVYDGVAATPYAVNEVRKMADEAQKKAEQAFTLGDKQRDTLAGSLSSKGVDLPTNPSWDRLQSEVARLKNVKKATIEVSEGQTVINIGFDPDALNVMSEDILDTASVNFSLDGGYFVLGDAFDSRRYPFVVAKDTITITGKGSPINFTLIAYNGLD